MVFSDYSAAAALKKPYKTVIIEIAGISFPGSR